LRQKSQEFLDINFVSYMWPYEGVGSNGYNAVGKFRDTLILVELL